MDMSSELDGDEAFDELKEEHNDSYNVFDILVDTSCILNCEGIDHDKWFGRILLAWHSDGSDFVNVIIITMNPNALIDGQKHLGKDDIGIMVLEVHNGDLDIEDMCLRWPTQRLFYNGATGLVNVYDHVCRRIVLEAELEGNRKTLRKRKYQYDQCHHAAAWDTKKTKMLSWEFVVRVFEGSCCDEDCTKKFPPSIVRALCIELHLQSFQVKSSRMLDVYRTMHTSDESRKEVVTIEGIEICANAWRIIHNVPQRTFQRYKVKAKSDVKSAPHGNLNRRKMRTPTIQAIEMLCSLLEASADYIPHLTRTL